MSLMKPFFNGHWLQVQNTKKEMKATSAEIDENRAALASFLAGMRVQVLKYTFLPVVTGKLTSRQFCH